MERLAYEDSKSCIQTEPCDPDLDPETVNNLKFLTQNEQDYFLRMMHGAGSVAALVHLNSEDSSDSIGNKMSEGNSCVFHFGAEVSPEIFPKRMFGYIVAVKLQGRNIKKSAIRGAQEKLGVFLDSSRSEKMDVLSVLGGGSSVKGNKEVIGDSARWTASLLSAPCNWVGFRYRKLKDGSKQYWLVAHICCDSISESFHQWIRNLAAASERNSVSLQKVYESTAYSALSSLARRHCCRLMYDVAQVLDLRVDNMDDLLAFKDDPREDTPKQVVPDMVTQYNYLVTNQLQGKPVIMLLNKTTNIRNTKGMLFMTQPLSPMMMYDWSCNHQKNKYDKCTHDNFSLHTAPVCLGRHKHKSHYYPSSSSSQQQQQQQQQGAKKKKTKQQQQQHGVVILDRARKWYYWKGKQAGSEIPTRILDTSYKPFTEKKKEILMRSMGLPEPYELHPIMTVISS